MDYDKKVLTYKGRVVIEKLTIPYFQRIPELFDKDEACFMFIIKGEFSVRIPDQFLTFNEGNGLLSKCFNYFFETNEDQRKSSDEKKYRVLILVSSVTIHSI